MRKSTFIIKILLLTLLIGCQDDDSSNLTIESQHIQVEYTGGNINIPISCNVASKASIIMIQPMNRAGFFCYQLY